MKTIGVIAVAMATGALIAGSQAAAQSNQTVERTVERTVGKILGGSGIKPAVKDILRGPCKIDLSVESIELRKTGPTGPTSIRMVITNVGSEAFSTTPVFAKAVIEVQDGATGAITRHAVGNIVVVQPGQSRQFAVTLRREVFGTFLPPRNNAGQIRASVEFSPNAPRCGIDPNSVNDELVATHEDVRGWLQGSQANVFVRR